MVGYDFLLVGAGLYNSVLARQLTDAGKKCLVIDKRFVVGGNCADYKYNNYYVSRYGGHYFHTNSDYVWEYINRFSKFTPYNFTAKVINKNEVFSYPINLFTMYQLWGVKTPDEAKKKIEEVKINIENPQNFEEKVLSLVGEEIYEKFILGYTTKMWGTDPKNISASLINRIVIRYDYDDRYFSDKYQAQPTNGYTKIFENLLEGIEVKLNTPYDKNIKAENVIYTGCIDEFYDYCYGELDYRGMKREWSDEDTGTAMLNYQDIDIPYLRKFSYSYPYQHVNNNGKFMTSIEYSTDGFVAKDYPVNNDKNNALYKKYKEINTPNVFFKGRLGNYQYWNMDQCIGAALNFAKELI